MQIHLRGFIIKHGHNTGRVNKQQTGMAGARHRVILRQAWVDDRRTISKRARQRDNPGTQAIIRTARQRVNPGNTGKNQNTGKHKRQDYDHWIGSVE